MTHSDFRSIMEFVHDLRLDNHWDLVSTWTKLMTDHAFYYCATETVMGIEVALAQERKDSANAKPGITMHSNPFRTEQFQVS